MIEELRHWIPMLALMTMSLALHLYMGRRAGRAARAALWAASVWMVVVVPLLADRWLDGVLSPGTIGYLLAGSLFWIVLALSAALVVWLREGTAGFDPERRRVLALATPLAAAPLAAAGIGVAVARHGLHVEPVRIPVRGLPRDLDGLRIAQLSDVHFGPFLGPAQLRHVVDMTNEARPHLVVLTGDLITRRNDDLHGCLKELRRLKADAGVYGCHGNHEIYARCQEQATRLGEGLGLHFLRGRSAVLKFGQAELNVVGFDYQPMHSFYLPGAERLRRSGAFNLMLQHNPVAFPRAAEAGYDLMLAGHTHGGQINIEILHENVNVARFYTPYVRGYYQLAGGQLYVSSGIGTVALPIRLGAPPEIPLIQLCAV
jgi:predicted MPP superfamily phosphohydrolase